MGVYGHSVTSRYTDFVTTLNSQIPIKYKGTTESFSKVLIDKFTIQVSFMKNNYLRKYSSKIKEFKKAKHTEYKKQ